jgi:hypothetical protein
MGCSVTPNVSRSFSPVRVTASATRRHTTPQQHSPQRTHNANPNRSPDARHSADLPAVYMSPNVPQNAGFSVRFSVSYLPTISHDFPTVSPMFFIRYRRFIRDNAADISPLFSTISQKIKTIYRHKKTNPPPPIKI